MTEQYQSNYEEHKQMPAKVSVTGELNSGFGNIKAEPMNEREAQDFAKQVSHYTVAVQESAPSKCIDGRPTSDFGKLTEPRPAISGGAGISGWIATELSQSSRPIHGKGEPWERFAKVVNQLEQNGIKVGGHCDTHFYLSATYAEPTGCGASDKLISIMSNLARRHKFIYKTAEVLMPDDYNQNVMWIVLADAEQLAKSNHLANWHGGNMISVITNVLKDDRKIEVLKDEPDETHGHHEQAVVLNYKDGTTIDRDRLVSETGQQVFTIDMWYLDKVAAALETKGITKNYLKHALVAYQLATYLTLADGSHRAIIIK